MNKQYAHFTLMIVGSIFLLSCGSNDIKLAAAMTSPVSKNDTVLLVGMDFQEKHLLPAIKARIASFYHLPAKYIEAPLPSEAYYKPRNRYRADSLLKYLKKFNPGRYSFVAGLTSKDISSTARQTPDWGIFGLGALDASACVNSTFRLRKNASQGLLSERIQKVILHELGHNRGLYHCTTSDPCFMKDAEGTIKTVDNEPMDVCKSCRKKMRL